MFDDCTKLLMAAGKPYPRTCAECGLVGPCKRGYDPQWTPANPVGYGPGGGKDADTIDTTDPRWCVCQYLKAVSRLPGDKPSPEQQADMIDAVYREHLRLLAEKMSKQSAAGCEPAASPNHGPGSP